jgi:PTS system fructose-specific IIC component
VKAERSAARTGVYKHLMTGVSYMLPLVVAGGIMIALAFAVGGAHVFEDQKEGTLGRALFQIGGPAASALMVPFLSAFIAYSIADRPGIAPMAAVMAAVITPPLGLALATVLFKNRFSTDEREAGKATWVMGASFITEGGIPFAAKDPSRVIPSIIVGSAVAAALSGVLGCELRVPHGGLFVLPIPNAVTDLGWYVVSIVAGTLVTTGMLFLLKRPAAQPLVRAEAPAAGE